MERLSGFLREFYRKHGTDGYFLKCDIRKFFDNIDHEILKRKLQKVFKEGKMLSLFYQIIDSYEKSPGKGLPLGNQTSQWFAIYYLDGLDRLIKEKLQIRYYSRYMDDCVLIHEDKDYLKHCLDVMCDYAETELNLSFNEKTKIFPIKERRRLSRMAFLYDRYRKGDPKRSSKARRSNISVNCAIFRKHTPKEELTLMK